MNVYIYGLFHGDRCRYVGQTRRPGSRKSGHKKAHRGLQFRILAMCDEANRNALEFELITEFRKQGECNLNVYPLVEKADSFIVCRITSGRKAAYMASAARAGISLTQWIVRALDRQSGYTEGEDEGQ